MNREERERLGRRYTKPDSLPPSWVRDAAHPFRCWDRVRYLGGEYVLSMVHYGERYCGLQHADWDIATTIPELRRGWPVPWEELELI